MIKNYVYITLAFLLLSISSVAQEEFYLLEQFNGKYDFTFVGNTLNYQENGIGIPCIIQTSSTAFLDLEEGNQLEKAYLYWSGSGTGDLEVKLNDITVTSERNYNLTYISSGLELHFFVAIADVTDLVQNTGNGIYTLSDFDVSENFSNPDISPYCRTSTNYGGWSLVIVYENENLPLNQLNIYEGFKNVPEVLNITLDNLNVIDNEGAQIGFVAWEGDSAIAVNETLRINGNIISNPPLNPENNAFNGTNSITGSSTLYNMDLDIYDIQDNIQVGDSTAEISLTSGQDLVIISTVVTKLNSQLPDATIQINAVQSYCSSNQIDIEYTVFNENSTDILPENTPISLYINGEFSILTFTQNIIPINGFETGNITVFIPDDFSENIEILLKVDDNNGIGEVTEVNENNNESNIIIITSFSVPLLNDLEDITSCNTGSKTAVFDFSEYEFQVKQNPEDIVSFYNFYEDALQGINHIFNINHYVLTNNFQKEIFVRIENDFCYEITSFYLNIKNCPPAIYNGISANNDGINDVFHIDGLYDIFEDFELFVFSRWGELIWKGNNNSPKWNGTVTEKKAVFNHLAPEGTYFYVLKLNDMNYPSDFSGYLHLTR